MVNCTKKRIASQNDNTFLKQLHDYFSMYIIKQNCMESSSRFLCVIEFFILINELC